MSAAIATARPSREGHRPSSAEQLADALLGLTWWNSISEPERAWWMQQAGSAVPADAWEEFRARQVRP